MLKNSSMRSAVVLATLLGMAGALLANQATPRARPGARQPVPQPGQPITGVEGLRMLHSHGKPSQAVEFGYGLLWQDIRQPEVLYLVANSLERVKKTGDAAALYALFLRTLPDDAPLELAKYKTIAERRLKALRQDDAVLRAAYSKTAAGKKFTAPEKVSDVWMNNVEADTFSLHGLYAWKLVGGRKDAKPDWIHNVQGRMHRSGMKLVEDAEGRKGILFGVPLKDMASPDADEHNRTALQQLGHNSRITARNTGGGKFLRIGARGYGFPLILKVKVGDEEVASPTVGIEAWSDLKIELPASAMKSSRPQLAGAAEKTPAGKPQRKPPVPGRAAAAVMQEAPVVTVELIVPDGQKWSEGVWIDYLDFFDD